VAPNPRDQKWFSLAEQASTETDQAKLMTLVNQLCAALDEHMKPLAGMSSDVRVSGLEMHC